MGEDLVRLQGLARHRGSDKLFLGQGAQLQPGSHHSKAY